MLKLVLAAFIAALMFAGGSADAQAPVKKKVLMANGSVPSVEREHQSPRVHSRSQLWAALAVSDVRDSPEGYGKDAWASQSKKEGERAARQDVLSRCHATLKTRGLPARCIAVASQEWMAALYCRSGQSTIGVGSTPADAANDALAQARAAGSAYCDFKAFRHPDHGLREMTASRWSATCSCRGGTFTRAAIGHEKEDSATLALNSAYGECNGSVEVAALDAMQ